MSKFDIRSKNGQNSGLRAKKVPIFEYSRQNIQNSKFLQGFWYSNTLEDTTDDFRKFTAKTNVII